jgi:hypothetical protein
VGRGGKEFAASVLGAVLGTAIVSWPLPTLVDTHVLAPPHAADFTVGTWWPVQVARAVGRGEWPFYARDLGWPDGQHLELLLWNIGPQLLTAPLAATFPPVTAFNLGCLLLNLLNGVAAGWFAATAAGEIGPRSNASSPGLAPLAAALAASLLLAGAPYPWHELANGRSEQGFLAPVVAYLALAPGALGGARPALPAALALAFSGAVYWFDAVFLGLFTALCVPLFPARRAALVNAIRVGALAALAALPFAAPVLWAALTRGQVYADLKHHVDASTLRQHAALMFPSALAWPLQPSLGATSAISLATLPALGWAALGGGLRGRWLAACGALALVLAAGERLEPRLAPLFGGVGNDPALPMAWLAKLPVFERFWWPYRLLGVIVPAVALAGGALAAAGTRVVGRGGLGLVIGTAVPLALAGVEGRELNRPGPNGSGLVMQPAAFSKAWEILGAAPYPSPLLYLPFPPAPSEAGERGLWAQAIHGQPINALVAWTVAEVEPGTRRKTMDLPLAKVLAGRGPVTGTRSFTAEESGGYRFVVIFGNDGIAQVLRERASELLGTPLHKDPEVALFAVPAAAGSR